MPILPLVISSIGAAATVGTGISIVTGTAGSIIGQATTATRDAAQAALAAANRITNNRNQFNTTNLETLTHENLKYYTVVSIGKYERKDAFNVVNTTTGGYKLPLPMTLVDTNAVNWEEKNIGIAAGAAMQGVSSNSAVTFESATEGLVGAAAAALSRRTGGFGEGVQALAGLAPNEFLTLLFKGPTYKNFNLQFVISPNTQQLSEKYHQMILKFKNAMAPSVVGIGGAAFSYPNIFQIYFVGSEKLYQFKPAVLKSFSVDYAGSSVPSFYRGTDAPETYRLTMQFQEIEFWLSGQFVDS